jgi:hypothetical protein
MIAASIADSLLTAPVIAFVVALLATMLKFEIRLPESLYPILSTFLLLAIGMKGGKALVASSPSDIWKPLLAALVLGIATPLIAFILFRVINRLDVINSAALAAHYGSVSAVTFTVVIATLETRGIEYEGFVAGLLAVLEIVGIVVALFLTRGASSNTNWKSALGEVVRGRSIALLAAERLRDIKSAGFKLVLLGILIPLINGFLGALVGVSAGMSTGGVAVMATLAGSASYIAAPAAVRIALPQASPGLYVTASLGVTFPFNLTLGIPYYIAIAQALT